VTPALGPLAAYVVGAVPVGFLVARGFGIGDIRSHGSGNIGATNVLRAAGRRAAMLTLAGDIAKGCAATALGAALAPGPTGAASAAVAAIAGNCWSVFLGFRGGKGVATGLGAFLYLVPWATVPAAVVWVAITLTFRYVSLGSLMAAACVPLGALALRYPLPSVVASAVGAAIVIFRHHDNIRRLASGTERRLGTRREAA
jgi:glycerol-3-phosphate acyltransferase PlsY